MKTKMCHYVLSHREQILNRPKQMRESVENKKQQKIFVMNKNENGKENKIFRCINFTLM